MRAPEAAGVMGEGSTIWCSRCRIDIYSTVKTPYNDTTYLADRIVIPRVSLYSVFVYKMLSRAQAVLAFGLRLPPEDGLVPRYSFSMQHADCAGQNSTPNINFGTFCSNTNALIYYI